MLAGRGTFATLRRQSRPWTSCDRSPSPGQLRRRDRPLGRRQVDAAAHDQPPAWIPAKAASSATGSDVTALKGKALRDWRARCAMIFQQFNLVGRLDVLTNVLMGRLNKVSTVDVRAPALERRGPGHRAVRARAARHRRPRRAARRQPFRRPAAARRHRPRAGAGARDHPGRRADRLARPAQHQGRDGRAAAHQPALRHHRAVQPALARSRPHLLRPARRHGGRAAWCSTARPTALTDDVARELYGLEAGDVIDDAPPATPPSAQARPPAA